MIKLKDLLLENITNGKLTDKVEQQILKNFSSGENILKTIAKKYEEIPKGKYIGDCSAHKCDMNSMKKSRQEGYDLYHGILLILTNKGDLDTLTTHTFNVKNGKVYEFTKLEDNFNRLKYFGKKVDKKDWKGYQYDNMKKYSI